MILRAAVILVLSLAVAPLGAQPPPAGDAAVAYGKEALDLYNQQRWVEAFERFSRAESLHHSPVFLLYMARCKRYLGDLVEAKRLLARVTSEPRDGAPETWARAIDDAVSDHADLAPRVPSLRITAPSGASVTIDDKPVAKERLAGLVEVNPGLRRVRARLGEQQGSADVEVAEGEKGRPVTIRFGVAARKIEPTAEPEPRREEPPAGGGSYVPGAVVLAIGGAGLIVGGITGGLALSLASEIDEGCVDNSCLTSDAEKGQRADTLATVSTVCFVVGGAAAATGIALLIIRPGEGGSALTLGPGQVTWRGAF
jgi:hypothetical protein